MNPIPVVIDKVLLALELYPISSLSVFSCENGEIRESPDSSNGLPLHCSGCSPPCTPGEPLCSATAHYPLEELEYRKPRQHSFRLAYLNYKPNVAVANSRAIKNFKRVAR